MQFALYSVVLPNQKMEYCASHPVELMNLEFHQRKRVFISVDAEKFLRFSLTGSKSREKV